MLLSRLCLIVAIYLILAIYAFAEIPQMITYQGKVTDSGGDAIADGSYTMRFYLYDQETGGTQQWDSGNLSVQVSSGIFSVLLGDGNPITIEFSDDCWLC